MYHGRTSFAGAAEFATPRIEFRASVVSKVARLSRFILRTVPLKRAVCGAVGLLKRTLKRRW